MQRTLAALAVIAVLALAGCGGGDSSTGAATSTGASTTASTTTSTAPAAPTATSTTAGTADAVDVVAEDIKFTKKSYEATAGEVTITYHDEGAIEHSLLIDGVQGFELDVKTHGAVDTGTVTLKPGTYTLYCGMPGHRAAGMQATLTVS